MSDPKSIRAPFMRDRKRDLASASGPELLASKVEQVLGTEGDTATSSGEMPWRTAFGSGLYALRHHNSDDALAALGYVYARDALRRWVPEAELLGVTVTREGDALYVRIRFREAALGARGAEVTTEMSLASG
jgi:phage baseplate assembly protein W